MQPVLILVLGAALTAVAVGAASVSVSAGNIYFTNEAGNSKQLTSSGLDSEPVLSPDGKWVVFVRSTSGNPTMTGTGDDIEPTELWQIGATGRDATLLVRCRNADMTTVIAAFHDIHFSFLGRYVFFITPAWAVSGAVHVVDTTNAKEHFVCPGNGLEVLHSGEYRDYLLVEQHRYFLGGGSYDWWWLFSPDGKEVGPVGEDTSNFKERYLRE
jgi:WD40-like Beta Propeller Repeat